MKTLRIMTIALSLAALLPAYAGASTLNLWRISFYRGGFGLQEFGTGTFTVVEPETLFTNLRTWNFTLNLSLFGRDIEYIMSDVNTTVDPIFFFADTIYGRLPLLSNRGIPEISGENPARLEFFSNLDNLQGWRLTATTSCGTPPISCTQVFQGGYDMIRLGPVNPDPVDPDPGPDPVSPTPIPLPATGALLALGLGAMSAFRRRKRG